MNNIQDPLTRLFAKHRIVFWYDTDREFRDDFNTVELAGVEKLEITNNEFGLKYHILREAPEGKFLLYHAGPEPSEKMENWLLDVQLAQGEFRTDLVSMYLGDLGLGVEFVDLVREHLDFFQSNKRKSALRKLLQERDTASRIRLKMLAVCVGVEPRPMCQNSLRLGKPEVKAFRQ